MTKQIFPERYPRMCVILKSKAIPINHALLDANERIWLSATGNLEVAICWLLPTVLGEKNGRQPPPTEVPIWQSLPTTPQSSSNDVSELDAWEDSSSVTTIRLFLSSGPSSKLTLQTLCIVWHLVMARVCLLKSRRDVATFNRISDRSWSGVQKPSGSHARNRPLSFSTSRTIDQEKSRFPVCVSSACSSFLASINPLKRQFPGWKMHGFFLS